jgi:hypothetical protein
MGYVGIKILKFSILPVILLLIFISLVFFDIATYLIAYISSLTYKLIHPSNPLTPFSWIGLGISYISLYFFVFTIFLYKIVTYTFKKEKIFLYSFYFCLSICLVFFLYGLYVQFS